MTGEGMNPIMDKGIREDLAKQGYVTKWICLAEVMGADGEKALVTSRGPSAAEMPIWDARGMLYEALMDPSMFGGTGDSGDG